VEVGGLDNRLAGFAIPDLPEQLGHVPLLGLLPLVMVYELPDIHEGSLLPFLILLQ